MRLLKELPQIEEKIETGKLSLSNISQAQSHFREAKKVAPMNTLPKADKMKLLESLENKSAREGQKILLARQPESTLPKERERIISPTHTEVRFVVTEDLKSKLEEVRSLLGPKGSALSWLELVEIMADKSIESLKSSRFGKNRALATPTPESRRTRVPKGESSNPRYLSMALRHRVWQRDQGKCRQCGGQRNLNVDHIQPVALGGGSRLENLRLLCFHCNQRQAIKSFGLEHMQRNIT